MFIEFLIGLAALALLFFAVYNIMLRPYRNVYRAIEEYDKTDKLKKIKIKGCAGRRVAGLGLAINREITELHGGRIYAEKSHLGGLRVCIELERQKQI